MHLGTKSYYDHARAQLLNTARLLVCMRGHAKGNQSVRLQSQTISIHAKKTQKSVLYIVSISYYLLCACLRTWELFVYVWVSIRRVCRRWIRAVTGSQGDCVKPLEPAGWLEMWFQMITESASLVGYCLFLVVINKNKTKQNKTCFSPQLLWKDSIKEHSDYTPLFLSLSEIVRLRGLKK